MNWASGEEKGLRKVPGRGLKSTFPQELHAAGLIPDRHFQSQHNLPGRLPPHSILMIFLFFVSESPSLVSYSLCS